MYYNQAQPTQIDNSRNYVSTTPAHNQGNRRFKWTRDGKPICGHCDVPGHMRAHCWKLYPEQRQNRAVNILAPPTGNAEN